MANDRDSYKIMSRKDCRNECTIGFDEMLPDVKFSGRPFRVPNNAEKQKQVLAVAN